MDFGEKPWKEAQQQAINNETKIIEPEKIYCEVPEALKKLKPWHIAVGMIPQCEQRQDALNNQLKDLILVANKLGCYDAADYLKRVISK